MLVLLANTFILYQVITKKSIYVNYIELNSIKRSIYIFDNLLTNINASNPYLHWELLPLKFHF